MSVAIVAVTVIGALVGTTGYFADVTGSIDLGPAISYVQRYGAFTIAVCALLFSVTNEPLPGSGDEHITCSEY